MAKFGNKSFLSPVKLAKSFGRPVITHAVPDGKIFLSIIKHGLIKTPSEREVRIKHPFMNRFFDIHDCVYLGAGWEYNSTFHHWPFAFIFKPSILKRRSIQFFKTYIVSQGWMEVLRYWKKHDLSYLMRLRNRSNACKKQIDLFLAKDACSFWLFEKDLEYFLKRYPDKDRIFKRLRQFHKKSLVSNTYSPRYASEHYYDETRRKEIISRKAVPIDINEFIGLYIRADKLSTTLPIIRKLFSKNILIFDGKRQFSLF